MQSPEGTKRIEISPTESTQCLYDAVREAFALPGYWFSLYKERGRKQEVPSSKSQPIGASGFGHGDLIYMMPNNGGVINSEPGSSKSNGESRASTGPSTPTTPQGKSPLKILFVDLFGFQRQELLKTKWTKFSDSNPPKLNESGTRNSASTAPIADAFTARRWNPTTSRT